MTRCPAFAPIAPARRFGPPRQCSRHTQDLDPVSMPAARSSGRRVRLRPPSSSRCEHPAMRFPRGSAALGSFVTIAILVAVPASVGSVRDPRRVAPASPPPSVGVGSAVTARHSVPPGERRAKRLFTNGCHYGRRGMSRCAGLLGGAYGANSDPAGWEKSAGHPLGVRRTYWGAGKETAAVRAAAADLKHLRVPWLSFKLPYSWTDMANGRGDHWVRSLVSQLGALNGPVWLAFHHEPEGDGDITEWVRMQRHLGPIVRSTAPNVAFSLIFTGWHEFYGPRRYRLSKLWPHVKVDLLGFDIYDKYGAFRNGQMFNNHTDMVGSYFTKIQAFAATHHVKWALAETGHTDLAATDDPDWVARTYHQLRDNGGIAMAYFNTWLNSSASWPLTGGKEPAFDDVLASTPTL